MAHNYCVGTDEEKEAWIVSHIRVEFRNGYREVMGLPVNEKDPISKSNKV